MRPIGRVGSSRVSARAGAPLSVLLTLAVGGVVLTCAPAPARAADTYCGLRAEPGLTLFEWRGAAPGDGEDWDDPRNWVGGDVPGQDDRADGYVCIDAAGDVNTASDTVRLGAGGAALLQAFDLAPGTDLVLDGADLMVFGDAEDRPSYVREASDGEPAASLTVTEAYFGGSGRTVVAGEVSLVPGIDGPASLDTQPCGAVPSVACDAGLPPGLLDVVRSGTLSLAKDVAPDVDRGVNLLRGYRIRVAGRAVLDGTTYVSADRDTEIEITDGGVLDLTGDGNVYEGFDRGRTELGLFRNAGLVRKSGGTGTSSINARYEQTDTGRVQVDSGTLSVGDRDRATVTAEVAGGGSVGTGRCAEAVTCDLTTTPGDPQFGVLTLPARDAAEVFVSEVGEYENARDLQPPVEVAVDGLSAGSQVEIALEYHPTIRQVPDKDDFALFQKRTGRPYRQLPTCDAGGSIPRGVSACVDDRFSEASRFGARVRSRDPDGRYVVRDLTRAVVVPRARDGRIVIPTDGEAAPLSRLEVVEVSGAEGCEGGRDPRWTLEHQWRDQSKNDHGVGWTPSRPGRALGVRARAGDLEDLRGFEISVLQGPFVGVVKAVRHESRSVEWRGTAVVDQTDTVDGRDPDRPRWRILDGTRLTFEWRRFLDGAATDETVTATVADLVAETARDHGGPADTVAFGFGCDGTGVVLDDLLVFRTGDGRDDVYDFEPPQPRIDFAGALPRLECLLSSTDYPRSEGLMRLSGLTGRDRGDWRLLYSPTRDDDDKRVLAEGRSGNGTRLVRYSLARSGYIEFTFDGSDEYRRSSSGFGRIKVRPTVDLDRATLQVQLGRAATVTGKVRAREDRRQRFEIWVVRPGETRFSRVGRGRTDEQGRFRASWRPGRSGAHAVAIRVIGNDDVATVMSRSAVRVRVIKPPPPVPDPVVVPPAQSIPLEPTPPTDPGIQAGCVYRLSKAP